MLTLTTSPQFGTSRSDLEAIAERLTSSFFPTSLDDVTSAMSILEPADQRILAEILLAKGANPSTVRLALENVAPASNGVSAGVSLAFALLSTASMGVSAYHGYKRNQSIGWALVWGFFGGVFPVIVPVIAVAQGFGKRK